MNNEGLFLIVESDPFQAARFAGMAKHLGFQPQIYKDGLDAKQAIEKRLPAVLLTDLNLPVVDGFEVIRHLRRQIGALHVPVVAVSNLPSTRAIALKLKDELGITQILSKSLDDPTTQIILHEAVLLKTKEWVRDKITKGVVAKRESERIGLIANMGLMETQTLEPNLQTICENAAKVFKVPVALVTLVLQDKQWFKAHVGLHDKLLHDRGTPREWSFCSRAIESDQPEVLIIPDAKRNPQFQDNPLVVDGTIGSFMGAPLVTPDGTMLGTFCLIDSKPSEFNAADAELLQMLARRVTGELELQRQKYENEKIIEAFGANNSESKNRLSMLASVISQMDAGILIMNSARRIIIANPALASFAGREIGSIVGQTGQEFAKENVALFDDPSYYLKTMQLLPEGPYVARAEFELQRPQRRIVRWVAKPIQLPDGPGQMDVFTDITAEHDLHALQISRPVGVV